MTNLFTQQKINSGRQKDLDIAKGLAILLMVLVHVNEVYQSTDLEGGISNRIIEFLGSPPVAPIFMILLGLGIVYSRNNSSSNLFYRGISIFILGYALNFFRDFIPYSILAFTESDPSYTTEAYSSLLGIDILQFSGLAFLFFAFIKKFNIKTKHLPLFYIVFATINLLVKNFSTDNFLIDAVLGLIWGTNDYSWFPFLSWIGFVIAGYIFGEFLIKCTNTDYFYKQCLMYSTFTTIALWIYAYINKVSFGAFGELYQNTYYQHEMMGDIILLSTAIFWISCVHFITKFIPQNICNAFSRWSKNINLIYCIHWVLLGYSMLFLETESYTPLVIILISIVIFILSDIISSYYSKLKKKRKEKNQSKTL